ncbi:MAG: hypothetical protein R6V85_01935 [Polyangia bacterium]
MRWAPIAAFFTILLAARNAPAIGGAESDDGERSIFAYGAARLTAGYLHYPDAPGSPDGDDALTSTVLRLMLDGDLGGPASFELHLFGDLARVPAGETSGAFATAGSARTPYRSSRLRWDYWRNGGVAGRLGIDRALVSFDWRPLELGVGRMPINHSVTTIFAPNDFFAPFSATAINTEYKPGVDALRLSLETGTFGGIELDVVLGEDDGVPNLGRSALIGHLRTVALGVELALTGGRLAERWVAGASLQADAAGFGIRAEGHAGFPDTDGDGDLDDRDGDGDAPDGFHARLAAGIDRRFEWRNAVIAAEYAYLSDGASAPGRYARRAALLYPGDQPWLGRHYGALSAGLELVPILTLSGTAIANLEDGSGLALASLSYSIADEADAVAGVLAPWGRSARSGASAAEPPRPRSEMGLYPLVAFLETRFYF